METPSVTQYSTSLATGLAPRPAVANLPPYVPPQEGRSGKVRLDFNENTQPLPLPLDSADWTLYPEYQVLTSQLAEHWGLQSNQVLLTNGSDEALFLAPFTFLTAGQLALISDPTFQMIPHYLHLCGVVTHQVPVLPDTLQLDIPAWEAALSGRQAKMVILPSPDNPTGASMDLAIWERWLTAHPETLFLLDQAYGEYEANADAVLPMINRHGNLLVTRTFSKAWGLAGLRLGVLLGQPDLIQWLASVRSPFSVNQAAVKAVQHLLPQANRIMAEAQSSVQRKRWLIQELAERGIDVHPAGGNFMLLKLGLDATLFCAFMAKQGILLRNRSSLLWGMVRLSVGTQVECEQFLAAVDDYRRRTVILFDLDDTLVDTSQSFDTVVMDLVQQFSGQPLTREALYALRAEGGFNDDWVATETLLRRRGITDVSMETIAATGTRLYLERAPKTEQLMLPLEDLHRLKRRFPKLGIATGRYRQEYDAIWRDRLADVFDAVVCVDDNLAFRGKPQPDTLQAAMQQLDVQQGFYLGNAVDDMHAAKAAGLFPVGVVKTLDNEQLTIAGAVHVLSHIDQWVTVMPVS